MAAAFANIFGAAKDANCVDQSVSSSSIKAQAKPQKKYTLKILLSHDGDPLRLKVKKTTKWRKIFKSFGDYKGRNAHVLKFVYDGMPIREEQTVGDIIDDVEEDDEDEIHIDVFNHAYGAGY